MIAFDSVSGRIKKSLAANQGAAGTAKLAAPKVVPGSLKDRMMRCSLKTGNK